MGLGVNVMVRDGEGVGKTVLVGVFVGDAVAVHVAVGEGEGVYVLVNVRVGVAVGVGDNVAEAIGVGVRPQTGTATSSTYIAVRPFCPSLYVPNSTRTVMPLKAFSTYSQWVQVCEFSRMVRNLCSSAFRLS